MKLRLSHREKERQLQITAATFRARQHSIHNGAASKETHTHSLGQRNGPFFKFKLIGS